MRIRSRLAIVTRLLIIASIGATFVAITKNEAWASAADGRPAQVNVPRPFTVHDLLRQENYGQALIDPTGRWLVFEQSPSYDQLPDYGIQRFSRGQIFLVDLSKPIRPRPLFEPEPQTEYRLYEFSPLGQYLALYAISRGKARLVIYDIPERRLRAFRGSPQILTFSKRSAVWISADEIVYATLGGDLQPEMISARRYTGSKLFELWNKTWDGRQASATEVASHADGGGRDFFEGFLLKANARTNTTELIARGLFTDFKVSSDGRYLAGLRQGEHVQPRPDQLSDRLLDVRHQLTIFDLKTRINKVIAPEMDIDPGSLEWSLGSDALAFFAWRVNASAQTGLFHVYDAEKGQTQAWPHNGLNLVARDFQRPQSAVWLNGQLAVVARANPKEDKPPRFTDSLITGRNDSVSGKLDWFLLRLNSNAQNLTEEFHVVSPNPVTVTANGVCLLADGNLWQVGKDGSKTNLSDKISDKLEQTFYVSGSRLSSYSENVPFVAHEEGKLRYVLVERVENGRTKTFVPPSQQASLMTGSVRAGMALFRENADEGAKLLLQKGDGTTTEIRQVNNYLAEVAKPEWKTISYRIRGNRELQSGMLLPYHYTPGRRYPVVVEIYPGLSRAYGQSRIGEHGSFYAPELLAAKGYIVFYAANPEDLDRTKDGPIAGMAEVVLRGIDALIAEGYADPDRIGLMGYSQGGFSSLWLATQTDRFKSIVSINGWADMASHYFQGGFYRIFYVDQSPFIGSSGRYESVEGGSFKLGRTPWQDAGIYIRNSPVYRADSIKSPIMLIKSDMDSFSASQYEEMFTALYRLRKEARFVRYWGEGHELLSPANIRDMWYRTFAWFDEWSDISRDEKGNLVWDGDKVKLRNGSPPLKPEDFARFDQMILQKH